MKSEKNNSALLTIASWLVGLVVFWGTYHLLLDVAADRFGLIGLIELAHPGRHPSEGGEGDVTSYGVMGSALSIFFSVSGQAGSSIRVMRVAEQVKRIGRNTKLFLSA